MCRLECGAGYVIEASLSLHTSKWDRAIVNTAMLSVQRWKCNKLCGFSPLQTQFPTCLFARVSIQHDKLEEHSSPRSLGDGLIGLLHRAPEGGKKKKKHAGYLGFERDGGETPPGSDRGVFGVRVCSVSRCLFELVKVCAGCRAPRIHWVTDEPPPSQNPHVSMIQTRGPDLSLWISLLFPWWTKGAWNSGFESLLFFFVPVSKRTHTLFPVWSRMQRNKQWMCIMLQGGRGKTTSQQHMWMPS